MNVVVLIYVLSLAFQMGGAILLIINFGGNTRQRLINLYFPGAGIANNDGGDNAILEIDRVSECIKEIYANSKYDAVSTNIR